MITFIRTEFGRIGADTHITPREVIRDFIGLLDIAFQNPDMVLSDFIGKLDTEGPTSADNSDIDKEFAEFEI